MKPYLQPMSEEFIYASPEVPGATRYRLLLAPDVGALPAVDQLTERGRLMSESERNGHTGEEVALVALSSPGLLKDLLLTLAAALWAGLTGSTLLMLLVFAMSGTAQAAIDTVFM